MVYAAHDTDLDRKVAIRLLCDDLRGSDAGTVEAQAMAKSSHPNVPPVYEAGTLRSSRRGGSAAHLS